jgi:hypothetical protein
MMNIKHNPIFEIGKVEKFYTEKDGVPVKYVCTSASNMGTVAADIFYRTTPHPSFGNRYFGLYANKFTECDHQVMITNADPIEELDFDMVDIDGELHYSQDRHDYRTIGDISIDGGRAYLKLGGAIGKYAIKRLKLVDGEFVERKDERNDLDGHV